MGETKTIAVRPKTHSEIKQVNREMALRDAEDYTLNETLDEMLEAWRETQ